MKKLQLLLTAAVFTLCGFGQVPILYYDFEGNAARNSTTENTVEQSINAGSSSLVRWFTGGNPSVTYVSGAGTYNGGTSAGLAFSSNRWPLANPGVNASNCHGFNTSTLGFSGLKVSFDAATNQTGMYVGVSWSTDNSTFYAATTAPVALSLSYTNLEFSLPAAADNKSMVYIRIYAYGASANSSTFTFDNLTLEAGTITASKTLLNCAAIGLSLKSGTAYDPPYSNLSITGSNVVVSLGSRLKIQGSLAVSNNATFALTNDASMVGTGTVTIADGCTIQVASASPNGAIKGNIGTQTLSLGQHATVEYIGNAQQYQDAAGLPNVIVNNAVGTVLTGNVTVNGNLLVKSGLLSTGANKLTLKGNITRTGGSITGSTGEIIFNGTTAQTVEAGAFSGSFGTVTINNAAGVTSSADMAVDNSIALTAGTWTVSNATLAVGGTISRTAGYINPSAATIEYNGSSAQAILATVFTAPFKNLTINNGAGVSAAANTTINGNLALTAGTFSPAAFTLTINGNVSRSAGVVAASSTTVVFSGTAAQSIAAGVFTGSVGSLTINNAAGVTTAANITIAGTLHLPAGNFSISSSTLNLQGAINRTTGTISASAGAVVFNGNNAQAITAGVFATPLHTLTISNNAGVSTAANLTVLSSLVLTAGTFDIGTTTQTITGTITNNTGTMNATAGTVVLNGTATQSIPATALSATINNLTVDNAAGVIINADHTLSSALVLQAGYLGLNGKTLTLKGTVSGTGSFRGSDASAIAIAATGTLGTLRFDQATDGTTNALSALSITTGTAFLGSKLHLFTALNIAGGTMDLAAQNLVLKSTSAKTAYVAELKGTLNGETNVTVERFTPAWASRRWRLLTSPLLNTSINAAWQEGGRWNGSAGLSSTGYGTLITGQAQGSATAANNNGFDYWSAIAGSAASIRYYAASSVSAQASWQPLGSTLNTNAFDNHQAYLVFIRGDRTVSGGSTVGSTTVRANGKLKKGSFSVNVPTTQSHTLVGNPYASPLDFKKIYDANSSKIQPYFWVYQSSLGTSSGGYVLIRPVSAGSSLYEAIPGNGTQSAVNRLIHSGEGFFLMPGSSATGSNTITIEESHKSTGTPAVSVFRQMGETLAKLYINISTESGTGKTLLDGVLVELSESGVGSKVPKSPNSSENLSIQENGRDFILTSGSVPKLNDTVKLRLWNTTAKTYQIEIRSTNFSQIGLTPVLVDKFLKTEQTINLNEEGTVYSFSVTGETASKDVSRFAVVFKAASTLPLFVASLKAEGKGNGVSVQWRVPDETGIGTYEVEKSTDGRSFQLLGTVAARNAAGEQAYVYQDDQPFSITYYRIRMRGSAGETKYSSVVRVQWQKIATSFSVYPNPVTDKVLTLQLTSAPLGLYTLTLYNLAGQNLFQKSISHQGGTAAEMIVLPGTLITGYYKLEICDQNGKKEIRSINVTR